MVLREGIGRENIDTLGIPSAIVPVMIGNESLLRLGSRYLTHMGVLTNLVEYPAVPKRSARFRFQVMAEHTPEQAKTAALRVGRAIREAKLELEKLGLPVDLREPQQFATTIE